MKSMRVVYALGISFFITCFIILATSSEHVSFMFALLAIAGVVAVPTLAVLWFIDERRFRLSPTRVSTATAAQKRNAQLTGIAVIVGFILLVVLINR